MRLRALVVFFLVSTASVVFASGDFPMQNGWSRITPSVVWCGDPDPVTIEFHVVGRTDVAHVEVTNQVDTLPHIVLYDDGTHGDAVAGDNVFTAAGVILHCPIDTFRYDHSITVWTGTFLVTLKDGTQLVHGYPAKAGIVGPWLKGEFPAHDLGKGLSMTDYALFINDSNRQVMAGYPVSNVVCGTENMEAYRKLYSVFPDDFDVAVVTPGMTLWRADNFGENVPYNVSVSNGVSHIGMQVKSNAAQFGSAGRLKSVIYESFYDIQIFDHEIAHTWGAAVGSSLGLIQLENNVEGLHFNALSDIGGQLSAYYFAPNGLIGHFHDNGDGTWRLIRNTENEPYSPLELYLMGFIPPEDVPPIHILSDPDLTNPNRITAKSVKTVTINDIIAEQGGTRTPSWSATPHELHVAYIVTQDGPYNDAAYAFFSVLSRQLMSLNPPEAYDMYSPFHWATGGRGLLNTLLTPVAPHRRPAHH